jgi:hypothetical protein
MVAYSFKARFAEPILDETKGGTIRAARLGRSRHARPDDELQLYQGMRTKHCRLITRKRCIAVDPIVMRFTMPTKIVLGERVLWSGPALAAFAVFDGFADFDEMRAFWEERDGFSGYHIRWLELPEAIR